MWRGVPHQFNALDPLMTASIASHAPFQGKGRQQSRADTTNLGVLTAARTFIRWRRKIWHGAPPDHYLYVIRTVACYSGEVLI